MKYEKYIEYHPRCYTTDTVFEFYYYYYYF